MHYIASDCHVITCACSAVKVVADNLVLLIPIKLHCVTVKKRLWHWFCSSSRSEIQTLEHIPSTFNERAQLVASLKAQISKCLANP